MTARRDAILDGLRALAALAVVLLHIDHPGVWLPDGAYTAVDLFFLISGFVIAQAYEARIRRTGVLPFLRARLIRLYPMLLLGLLILPAYFVAVFARHHIAPATPGQILAALGEGLVFLPAHLPASRLLDANLLFPLDGPVWSLMLEMAVNLAYALALPWLSNRALAFIVATCGAALVVAQATQGGLDLGWGWTNLWGGLPRAGFSFFLGVLIFRLDPPRPRTPPLLALAALPLLFLAPPILAILVAYPLLLVASTRPDAPAAPTLTALGELSYPLYVIHLPALYWIRWALPLDWPASAHLAASLALTLLAAFAALKLWDQPLRRYLTRRTAGPRPDTP